MKLLSLVSFLWFFAVALSAGPQDVHPIVSALPGGGREVDAATMERIYEQVKTPYKYGVVLKGEAGELVDCPNVFRHGDTWHMVYVKLDKKRTGYQTLLASSDDLIQWKERGVILSYPEAGWDQWQADGGIALRDYAWDGTNELQAYDGKYWLSYLGGNQHGYEPDPLSIGLAWATHPVQATPWTRLAQNPVLSNQQPDVRDFERQTLYKSYIIWDKSESLGYPFVMFYNGKKLNGFERIGMAVSRNMTEWRRYGSEPVIANGEEKNKGGISGDPQIVKIGDVWVMFYFGLYWDPGVAFDTFACSYDLVHWTKWAGEKLTQASEPYDRKSAHKPSVLSYHGIVYHFYCAVGDQGRVIALATSRPLNPPTATSEVSK